MVSYNFFPGSAYFCNPVAKTSAIEMQLLNEEPIVFRCPGAGKYEFVHSCSSTVVQARMIAGLNVEIPKKRADGGGPGMVTLELDGEKVYEGTMEQGLVAASRFKESEFNFGAKDIHGSRVGFFLANGSKARVVVEGFPGEDAALTILSAMYRTVVPARAPVGNL
jgi:hypothetical protein